MRVAASGGRLSDQREHFLTDCRQIGPRRNQNLGPDAFALAEHPEEDVLGPDVLLLQLHRFPQRQLQHLLGSRRHLDQDMALCPAEPLTSANDLDHLLASVFLLDPQITKHSPGDALLVGDQPEHQVLGPDVVVVEQARFLLGEDNNSSGLLSKALEHQVGSGDGIRARPSGPSGRPMISWITAAAIT